MNNRQKEVRNFKSVIIYFRPPKWAKWFMTWIWPKEKSKFLSLSSLFSLKQTKAHILLHVQPLKMLNQKAFLPILG